MAVRLLTSERLARSALLSWTATNAYAELWYGYAGGKWSFDIEDVFDTSFTDGC